MTYLQRLNSIRDLMKERGISAYIIPSSDPHISEYLPDRFKCIAWTSGFTGSAGTLVITANFAGLWTDARYFVQANEQLAGSGFELVKLQVQGKAEFVDWLAKELNPSDVVAFDGNLASVALVQTLKAQLEVAGVEIRGDVDLLEAIWSDRPNLPQQPAYLIGAETSGQTAAEKLTVIREHMAEKKADAHLVSSLDDLAWILNIRGGDVNCNPVVLGFLLVESQNATLFIDKAKINEEDRQTLESQGVVLKDYDTIVEHLAQNPFQRLLIDPKRSCYAIYDAACQASKEVLEDMNPSTWLKAIKNPVEIAHMREAMVKDGVALTQFFKWLEQQVATGELTEISIADKLQSLREARPGFVDISFDTIAGYKAHGALPHYKATPESDSVLTADGLLLLDSGGQYTNGTTDITRVVSLGNLTQEESDDYTIVLKGMIEGSTSIFPKGTRGYQIDAMTRRPIWAQMRDYGHGTGHGIGFFLNVHEGPHVFNKAAVDIPVVDGMITSIEPGLYRPGKHGIRIENLVLSKVIQENEFGDFMDFETLTLCYIATDLINRSLLDQRHIDWLNAYNARVYELLSPQLDAEHAAWLKEKTKAI